MKRFLAALLIVAAGIIIGGFWAFCIFGVRP